MDLTNVVFTGDSLTDEGKAPAWRQDFGIDLTNCYASVVARTFKFPWVNTAVGGIALKQIIADMDGYVFNHQPTHVFVDGGYNDFAVAGTTADTVAADMDSFVKQVTDKGIGCTIIFFPINYGDLSGIGQLPAKYQAIADNYGVDMINLNGSAMGSAPAVNMDYKIADGIHLNPKAHLYTANKVIEYICIKFGIENAGRVKKRLKQSK